MKTKNNTIGGKPYILSAYDAGYLELAISQEATLASLDKQLLKVAVNSGVLIYEI